MRHGKKFNHLSRKSAHRKAMLANMASSLIMHKRINTTVAKAKALRVYLEPLLTKSKTDSTHSRRTVFRYLRDKYAVSELFREIAPKIAERPGGYLRIIKTGFRQGDSADMAMIEFVDFNELYSASEKAKSGRRRRRRKKAGDQGGQNDPQAVVETSEPTENVEEGEEETTEQENKEGQIEDAVTVEEVEEKVEETKEEAENTAAESENEETTDDNTSDENTNDAKTDKE